jgi:hypothetical protein
LPTNAIFMGGHSSGSHSSHRTQRCLTRKTPPLVGFRAPAAKEQGERRWLAAPGWRQEAA